ncbi:hypothetical protein [Bdellovibrio bacteriovorus]|uniref:hypothetical protein n=1 Tax=Bdellovibrio bacteriovorus TaxID=959 RepID=UPI0035A6E407
MNSLSRKLNWWIQPLLIIVIFAVPAESRNAVALTVSLVSLGTQPITKNDLASLSPRDKVGNWIVTAIISGLTLELAYLQFFAK